MRKEKAETPRLTPSQSLLEKIRAREIPDAARTFLHRLFAAQGKSPHTVFAYAADLERYFYFLKKAGATYKSVARRNMEEFAEQLKLEETLHERSINRVLSAVKSFYRWLNDTEEFANSIRDWIEPPKFQRKLAIPLDENEIRQLLKTVQANPFQKPPRVWFQDYVMIRLLYATGMRLGDIVKLRSFDLDLAEKAALVRESKGKKSRWVAYDAGTKILLQEFLKKFPPKKGAPLFTNIRDKKPSAGALARHLENALKRYAARAGIAKNVYPHLLRHTCGVHLLENGADLKTIQDLFGHSSLATTQIYLELSPKARRKKYDAAHPLSKSF